jgi:hypothetical protein
VEVVVVVVVEEKDRREEERRERRREDEKRKDAAGGRRVVRLEKANGDQAEKEDETLQTSSRNGGRDDEGRGKTKSSVDTSASLAKRSKEPTPEAAEGEKR